jgi:N-acetylmuramic acid 6-phosphate etherase
MPESLFNEIAALPTEQKNPATAHIDSATTIEILELINNEDAKIAGAVRDELPHITRAVDAIVERFKRGGRLIYTGAGTSGRLGIVDASECPPTYGTPHEMVQALIAGGTPAIFKAQEGAEDNAEKGAEEIRELHVGVNDVVCGIAASGRTPYVVGAVRQAHDLGAFTIVVSTSTHEKVRSAHPTADVLICPNVGPEAIMGSTRMKSGTAQKLVLNMLTTASMVRIGKTFGNVMVDLQMTNEKLKERARKVLMDLTGLDYARATALLDSADGHVKTALVMAIADVDKATAQERLAGADGFVRQALQGLV